MDHDICLLSALGRFHPAKVWTALSWSRAALSLKHKYLSLLRITVQETHDPCICKPHSATTLLHLQASDVPAMHSHCCCCSFRRSSDTQSSRQHAISSTPGAIASGDFNTLIFDFWLLIWIGVSSSLPAVPETFPPKGSVSFPLSVSRVWAEGIVQLTGALA